MAVQKLRAVGPDEKGSPLSVSAAASSGDRLKLLLAMRTRVAKAVENTETPARDLAALTRRLLEIAKDIEALESAKEQDVHADDDAADDSFDASAI